MLAHARGKLERKAVDLIVANDARSRGGLRHHHQCRDACVDGRAEQAAPNQRPRWLTVLDRVEALLAARPVGSVG